MAIARITVFHARLPLWWPVDHAAARRNASENLFAVVELTDGTVGVGEGLPRPTVTGETMDMCWRALETFEVEALVAAWPSPHAIDRALEGLMAGERPAPSARAALEIALLDALGRATNRSAAAIAAEVLGLEPPGGRPIAYSAVLPFARPGLLRLLCWGVRAYGFRSAKLKVGRSVDEDARRLRAVRGWLGPAVELRADANGAWSPDEALAVIEVCPRVRLAALEQPVPPGAWGALAERLPSPPPVALMADESVCTMGDLERLTASTALQGINCRIAKMGGLIPAARIGRAAAGLDLLVGCHVGESTVLSAAGRHLAALLPEARWHEGSYDRWLVRASLATKPLRFGPGGRAAVELAAGLGVELRRTVLERLTLRRRALWPPGGGLA
ncbi:MAG: mandelate racemase/muconate lactonizing enzyme family protein [Nitrospinota bacterium]